MICFNNVSFRYGKGNESIKGINLTINKGDVILVCGPSGCGKTTLIRCVNGLVPHFYEGELDGSVTVNGIEIKETSLKKISRHVGTVFQNPRSQFFNVDTTSELAFGCENLGMHPDEIEQRINDTVNRHGLGSLMDRSIFKLSGGEKQKIACASVSVEPVDVIILDEPSANLDHKAICELRKMIEVWKEEQKTILIAEHRISYLLPYITGAVLMNDGEVVKQYSAVDFKALSTQELHSMGLRSAEMMDPEEIDVERDENHILLDKMILSNMKFAYKKEEPVFDIPRMEIPVGEIIAVIGTNGAGKSTFLRCLCGLEKRCKATLRLGDEIWKNKERRQNIYLVMQDVNHQLFTDSVLEEVMISQEREDKDAALKILESLDLLEYAQRHPLSLSGGQKQRVSIASAIASERKIVLFDEPTSGLDYRHMLQVSEICKKLKDSGKTVMIVTHDAELIKSACTHIIHFQKIVGTGME